tara:strand:- start:1832 stop:2956 length:1125 start_codon:yes stop_codon:yes gene_type:complete
MIKKRAVPWADPILDQKEITKVLKVFKSQRFTSGLNVKLLEKKIAKYCNAKYALLVSNGTVALDLALKSQHINQNDEVIVPAMTYFSTASSISYQNAKPVFVDINPDTFNLDPDKIQRAITKKTKAIIFIDYGGFPAEVDKIKKIAKINNLKLIHDAAQSLGAKYKNKNMGLNGDISTMSFHMAKIMTTIEGGVIFTNNSRTYHEIKTLRNIGEPSNKKYIHTHLGTNARMTEIQAAIGLSQFSKLNNFLVKRKKICLKYNKILKGMKNIIKLPIIEEKNKKSANFFYPILVNNRDFVAKKLRSDYNIDTRVAYPMPIYNQPIYKNNKMSFKKELCKNAEYVTSKVLNLPLYPSMKTSDIFYVTNSLKKILNNK